MADNASATTAATAASSAVSSVTTRSQQQNGDDGNPTNASDHNHKKAREPFKGKSDKVSGHVFQLSAEGRKANQFSETMKAFRDYANVELDNPQDLAAWFEEPCSHVVLVEPPLGADGATTVTAHHRKYPTLSPSVATSTQRHSSTHTRCY
jgi:hypothetical protein